jgi:membrane protease subunit HflC
MKLTMPILALLVAALIVLSQSIYTVDQRQYAIKFQLGEIIETKGQAGLYFKVPLVQNIRYYDKRNLVLDNPDSDRITTSEKTPLLVDFIVLWRIIDVRQFYISVQGDEEAARRRLVQTVRANLAEELNRRTMYQAISSERDQIMAATRAKADADARSIGVEIVDVRLRRVDLPPDVTGPVYARMESERRRVANERRSEGAAESEKIRADADRQRQVILAEAYRDAQKTKGEGDAKASAVYAQAYGGNPEFYRFYRSLEAYRASLRGRNDVMVLDPNSEFFQYFKQSAAGRTPPGPPPSPPAAPAKPAPAR